MSREQPIVLLQDFHPDKHVSFITGGTGEEKWNPIDNIRSRTMGESVFLSSNSGQFVKKEANFQKMQYDAPVFPSHCVKGTEEAKLIDGLCEAVGGVYDKDFACKVDADKYPNVKVVQKGTNKNIDSFGGIYDNRMGYITELQGFASRELAERSSWGVLEWLNSKEVKSVETIGIADDYCVKTTALDLANKQKAEMANAIAIPHVIINPQYTYGIVAQLWEKDDGGHGVQELYENLIGDLYQSKLEGNGEVEVKKQPAKGEL
jgi:nicotinamidase-related amidase